MFTVLALKVGVKPFITNLGAGVLSPFPVCLTVPGAQESAVRYFSEASNQARGSKGLLELSNPPG